MNEKVVGLLRRVVLCSAFLFGGHAAFGAIPEQLELPLGGRHIVVFPTPVEAVEASTLAVALSYQGDARLIITAQRAGVADVRYTLRTGETGVIAVKVAGGGEDLKIEEVARFIGERLKDVIGVQVKSDAALGLVVVEGTVRTVRDRNTLARELESASRRWGHLVQNSTTVSIDTTVISKELETLLDEIGVAEAKVTIAGDVSRLHMTGSARTEEVRQRAQSEIERVSTQLKLDLTVSNGITVADDLFTVEVMFFTYSDTLQQDIGMDLLNNMGLSMSGGFEARSDYEPTYTFEANLNLDRILNFLAGEGLVSSLKRTTITAKNGETGSSGFGGSVVIPIIGDATRTSAVSEQEFGDLIEVTPTFASGGRVNIRLKGEISVIRGISPQGYVEFIRNSVNTAVNVPLDRSLVIGMSATEGYTTTDTGVPYLRNIPILDLVFAGQKTVKETIHSGFVVTPRLGETRQTVDAGIERRTDEIIAKIREKIN